MFDTRHALHHDSVCNSVRIELLLDKVVHCSPLSNNSHESFREQWKQSTIYPMFWRKHRDPIEKLSAQLHKRNPEKRLQAVEALGATGDPRAMTPLVNALGDKHDAVRRKAMTVLSDIGLPAVNAVLTALERKDLQSQQCAVHVLGTIGGTQAIHALIDLLGEPHSNMWAHAADALHQIGTPVISYLWDALDNINAAVRDRALELLGMIDDPQATAYLIQALGHHSSYIRETATEVLSRKGAAAITLLHQVIIEDNPLLVSQAIDVLGKIGGGQVILPLRQALAHERWQVRQHAVNALAELDDAQATEALAKVLYDPYLQVRESAIEALDQKRDDQTITLLSEALRDPNQRLRARVMSLLGDIGDQRVVDPLISALEDPDSDIRQYAIMLLGRIGDSRAIEPLVRILQTDRQEIQQQVAQVLGAFRDARVISPLLQLLAATDTVVGEEVDKLLAHLLPVVEIVVFGDMAHEAFDEQTSLCNPDVSALTLPMPNLKTIAIDTGRYDFRLVERFITYTLNTISQSTLKKQVVVNVYGEQELHPHLWNNLQNCCKAVKKQETVPLQV